MQSLLWCAQSRLLETFGRGDLGASEGMGQASLLGGYLMFFFLKRLFLVVLFYIFIFFLKCLFFVVWFYFFKRPFWALDDTQKLSHCLDGLSLVFTMDRRGCQKRMLLSFKRLFESRKLPRNLRNSLEPLQTLEISQNTPSLTPRLKPPQLFLV